MTHVILRSRLCRYYYRASYTSLPRANYTFSNTTLSEHQTSDSPTNYNPAPRLASVSVYILQSFQTYLDKLQFSKLKPYLFILVQASSPVRSVEKDILRKALWQSTETPSSQDSLKFEIKSVNTKIRTLRKRDQSKWSLKKNLKLWTGKIRSYTYNLIYSFVSLIKLKKTIQRAG